MKIWSLLVGVGACTFLVGVSADAATTYYAGSSCHQLLTTSGVSILYDIGLARNMADSTKWFGCPGVQQGGRIVSATVTVRDISPVAGFRCYAINSDQSGIGGFQTASATTSAAAMGAITLNLGGLTPAQFVPLGSKSIVCSVPPNAAFDGSAVSTYSIQEE
jgi:hypothetical protein